MEVAIPFVTAQLINAIQAGATVADMLPYAGILIAMALASLAFGIGRGHHLLRGQLRLCQEPAS